jgi:hypothetical protein
MISLSMYDANDFIISTMLDGEPYKLHFSWNVHVPQWTVDILTNDNVEIVRGIPVVPNLPLLSFYRRQNGLPQGELLAVVVNQDEEENQAVGRRDFLNGKFSMVYVPVGEVNAILEASL